MLVQVPQEHDTPLQRGRSGGFAWRYRYARAADAREAETSGQDYLTLHVAEGSLAFALCDGVSHSFFGNLAARFLGDSLLSWLDQEATLTGEVNSSLGTALREHLAAIVDEATAVVEQFPLPAAMPALQREALEEARQRGSESTFVCGRIDFPDGSVAHGRLLLAWMGDSVLRLWGPDGEISSMLEGAFATAERWSSRSGPVGSSPHVFVCPLLVEGRLAITRVAAYSDGLQALDRSADLPDDETLELLVAALADSPTRDDVSFLDIALTPVQQVMPLPVVIPAYGQVEAGDAGAITASVPGALPAATAPGGLVSAQVVASATRNVAAGRLRRWYVGLPAAGLLALALLAVTLGWFRQAQQSPGYAPALLVEIPATLAPLVIVPTAPPATAVPTATPMATATPTSLPIATPTRRSPLTSRSHACSMIGRSSGEPGRVATSPRLGADLRTTSPKERQTMQHVLVSVSRYGDSASYDLDVPAEVEAVDLAALIAQELETLAPSGNPADRYELDVPEQQRSLPPEETLAAAEVWGGSHLVLRRAEQPGPFTKKPGDSKPAVSRDTPVTRWVPLGINVPPGRQQ